METKITYVFILTIGISIGYFGGQNLKPIPQKQQKKILYWVAPMDQNYRRDKPGKSPMGMDLVPVYAGDGEQTSSHVGVKINPITQNNISVSVAEVEVKNISKQIQTVGYVAVDENTIDKINSYVDGWIRNLQISSNGVTVKKGDLLFELYSPTLISAEEEYLLALKSNPTLVKPSEQKLKTLGMSEAQINILKSEMKTQETLRVYAEVSGIVSTLSIRDGAYIKPDQTLLTITDLSHIWIDAEIYDKDVSLISIGQKGMASFSAYPNKQWLGEITFIYPELNATSRTLKVRLAFPNPDLLLKPNMFSDIVIYTEPVKDALVIPQSALIENNNLQYVIVKDEDDYFYAQEVEPGLHTDNLVQIKRGLTKGQKIVTSGQFLIDSESNVQQSLQRIANTKTMENTAHEIIGQGKILEIDPKASILTLDHAPIPTINMPSMVMKFTVDKDVSLFKLSAGQSITFMLRQDKNGTYVICHIDPLHEVQHD